ncbi:MAG: hypothetical protein R6U20_00625, partial [Longimonas sp.]|uniref:hypothetical protein n=1 Tax=Longimonas sp. TaxID=2039626 RepID=UPI003976CC66
MRIVSPRTCWTLTLGLLLALCSASLAHAQQVLDHDDYAIWNQMHTHALAPNGASVLYVLGPEQGNDTLRVAQSDGTPLLDVPRSAHDAQFTANSQHVVTRIVPPTDTDDEDAPDSLAVASVDTGEVERIPDIASFRLPEEGGNWIAYRQADTTDADADDASENADSDTSDTREDVGSTLVLRSLESGEERSYEHATDEYAMSPNGAWLVFARATPDSTDDGVFAVPTETGDARPLLTGPGSYTHLTLDEDSEQVAFLTNRDDVDAEAISADASAHTLYHASLAEDAERVAGWSTDGLPDDWWVSEHGSLSFSDDGTRLFFGTAPQPAPDTTATLLDEPVEVDVWHWQDERPQSVQLNDRDDELQRSYQAVAHLDDDNRIVQLATEERPEVEVGSNGNADRAVANTSRPYQQEMSWDFPSYHDVYLINVNTGDARQVQERIQAEAELSPEAEYLTWWDGTAETWWAQSVEAGSTPVDLGQAIDAPLYNEDHDLPASPFPYGSA